MFERNTARALASLMVCLSLLLVPGIVHGATPVVPIVSGPYLVGGVRNGQWIDSKTTAQALRGGERYRILTTAGAGGSRIGERPTYEEICANTAFVRLQAPATPAQFVAVSGARNPLPRTPQALSTGSTVYRQAVADILRAQGIGQPDVRITKIVRIDLEGDGVDEVLINATRYTASLPSDANPGDYSLVVVRKLVNGTVRTLPLRAEYYPKGGEFSAPLTFTLAAVADLNGDNRMEIMVNEAYYEGSAATLFGVNGTRVTPLLQTGCGV